VPKKNVCPAYKTRRQQLEKMALVELRPDAECQVPNNKSQIPKKYQLQVNPKTVE
jgi:hypothetical protein